MMYFCTVAKSPLVRTRVRHLTTVSVGPSKGAMQLDEIVVFQLHGFVWGMGEKKPIYEYIINIIIESQFEKLNKPARELSFSPSIDMRRKNSSSWRRESTPGPACRGGQMREPT
jgi:hypothetical protein